MKRLLTASIIIASLLLTNNTTSKINTEGEITKGYYEGNSYKNPFFGLTIESKQVMFGPEHFEKIGVSYDALELMTEKKANMMSLPLMIIPFDKLDVDSSYVEIMIATNTHFSGDREMFYKAMNFRFEDEDENIKVFDADIGGIACKTSCITQDREVYTTSIIEAGKYNLVIYTKSASLQEEEFVSNTLDQISFSNINYVS